jgi:hypothetical protein
MLALVQRDGVGRRRAVVPFSSGRRQRAVQKPGAWVSNGRGKPLSTGARTKADPGVRGPPIGLGVLRPRGKGSDQKGAPGASDQPFGGSAS